MKIKINLVLNIICLILLVLSCESKVNNENQGLNRKEHLNLIICSDLSNRLTLYKKPLHDTVLISNFLDFYYPEIYHSGKRKLGQEDKIQVLLYNGKNMKNFNLSDKKMSLDFSKFNNKERIEYVKGQTSTYLEDRLTFKKEQKKIYKTVANRVQGADTYSLLEKRVDNAMLKINEKEKYRDILILFTDGYIEYGSKQRIGNKTYYLDQALVKEFKVRFKKEAEDKIPTKENLKQFFIKEGYGLIPIDSPNLKKLEILALEFYDRSLSTDNNAIERPTDVEIINLFWEDWMKTSKVKRFKSYEVFNSKKEFKNSVIDFIGNPHNYLMN